VRTLTVQKAETLALMWDSQTPQLLLCDLAVDFDSSIVIRRLK
jgi:hypothetical protein